jgi:hypothetical protein
MQHIMKKSEKAKMPIRTSVKKMRLNVDMQSDYLMFSASSCSSLQSKPVIMPVLGSKTD